MEENIQSKENKMGVMPVNRLLITMSLPMVISMLVQALYNIVDSVFVAQINEAALTAVSMAFPIQNLMIAVAAGTGTGVNALLSKSLGEKNKRMVDDTANMGVFLALCSYAVFAIIGIFLSRIYFAAQISDAQIIEYGDEYMSVICLFSFGLFGQIITERLLQATGRTIFTMFTQGIGAIINIILDPILIFGLLGLPAMGVTGAAAATVIGQIIAAILGFVCNAVYNHDITLSIKGIFTIDTTVISKVYRVGIPSIIMQSITSVMTFSLNKILAEFSSTAVAVFGVYYKLNSFIFMPVFGMNNGLVPILSYNYGARKPDRIKKTIKLGMKYAVAIMIFGLLLFELFPSGLLGIFDASQEMLSIGCVALRIIASSFVFAGVAIICSTVFQAIGNPLHSLIMSVCRQLLVIVPVAWLLSLSGRLELVWLAFPIAEFVSVAMSIFFMKKTIRHLDGMA
ncbi:MAG: MATE family efflux transporter [Clostridia bacterium]|nr:MATE family efflux transporter [[Bacteroides] pectinophilus]MDD5872851.1 MATE family efflux transporter [Clostridia bacterium]